MNNSDVFGVFAFLAAYIVVIAIVAIVCYVLYGISHMKALKALGYDKAWLAWIPYGNYFAMADAVIGDEESVNLFGNVNVPAMVYKLWWLGAIVGSFIPAVGSLLVLVITIVFLGNTYGKMYAELEGKTLQETQAIGYVSGFISIIAVVKFLTGKYE